MTPLRMSYLERYRAEQQGYIERGLSASYPYAAKIMAKLIDCSLTAEAATELENLRAAMACRQPVAPILARLFVAAPTAFTI
jgi:hypothetical protein